MTALAAHASALAREAAVRHGVEVEDVHVRRLGKRTSIKVTIDSDSGVDSDMSALVAIGLRAALEADPVFRDVEYVLEVSSPGLDRPLVTPRRWRRNIGRLVDVELGDVTLTGRVVAVDDDGVEIRHGSGDLRRVAFEDIDRAVVRAEFTKHEEGQ